MTSYRWLLIGVAALTALLVFAACGDDDEDEEPEATATTAPSVEKPCEGGPGVRSIAGGGAHAQAAEPLKIGVLVPTTGALSTFGPEYINAANLAAKCINNAGGVNGAEVQLVTADTGTNPEQGVSEAQRLVDIEGVVAIVGAAASSVSLAVAESVTIPNEILQISPASTSPALTDVEDNDFLFRTPISDAAQGVVLGQLIYQDLGITSACALYVNNAYGQGLAAQFQETYESLGGTVTASVPHEDASEAVSYSAELNQCVEGGPETLVAISYPTGQAGVYLREALEGGVIDSFVFVDGTKDDELFTTLGWENFEGMFGTAPGALETAYGDAFDAVYEAEFGAPAQVPFVREAYDATIAIAFAAAAAGTNTDSVAIRDSLRNVSNAPGTVFGPSEEDLAGALAAIGSGEDIDYQGASGSVDFDENGDITFGAIEVWRIEGGAIVTDHRLSVDLATGEVAPLE
ncbi:MAG: ABC transporter substrate-binding protein [Chloroflexi bacterium]|nr:ABC transporter substrate-binding protein [Chloroflexota bacterium]